MNIRNYISIDFPSCSANEAFARAAAAAFASQLDPTMEELGDIRTAVSEAVTNCIVHAYPRELGRIRMRLRILDEDTLDIAVRDWGVGMENVQKAMEPLYTTGGEERSGMGFTIMQSFTDSLHVRSQPGLSDLRAARNGDKEVAGRLLEENSGLIWSVARRYFGRGTDPEDLYQLGCLGFLKALEGFDPEFGTQFSTYAVPKIAGEIRRFLRDDGAVKVSRGLKERAAKIFAARQVLEQRLGREPHVSELAAETGLDPEEIAVAEAANGPTESLQRESGEDGFTLELVLGDYGAEERMLEQVNLRSLIEELPERERKVIALRYYHGLTQQNCAKVLHVSQVQISRLEKRAVERLRERFDL